jgi:hypothetical protein
VLLYCLTRIDDPSITFPIRCVALHDLDLSSILAPDEIEYHKDRLTHVRKIMRSVSFSSTCSSHDTTLRRLSGSCPGNIPQSSANLYGDVRFSRKHVCMRFSISSILTGRRTCAEVLVILSVGSSCASVSWLSCRSLLTLDTCNSADVSLPITLSGRRESTRNSSGLFSVSCNEAT